MNFLSSFWITLLTFWPVKPITENWLSPSCSREREREIISSWHTVGWFLWAKSGEWTENRLAGPRCLATSPVCYHPLSDKQNEGSWGSLLLITYVMFQCDRNSRHADKDIVCWQSKLSFHDLFRVKLADRGSSKIQKSTTWKVKEDKKKGSKTQNAGNRKT